MLKASAGVSGSALAFISRSFQYYETIRNNQSKQSQFNQLFIQS